MPGVSFREVKNLVTMRDLLAHYEVQVRCTNPAKQQYKARCPLPTHSADTKESLEVNFEKNCFQCWSKSCGGKGGVLDFVMLMEGVNAYGAAVKILGWFG